MQRYFPGFPSGLPGFGLLLLRLAVGIHLCVGTLLAPEATSFSTIDSSVLGVIAAFGILAGVSTILGVVTPFIQPLVAMTQLSILANHIGFRDGLGGTETEVWLVSLTAVIATSLVLLGPGAYSIDARLFGRRQIIISTTRRNAETLRS